MDEMSKLREWRQDAPAPDRARLAPGRRRLLDAAGRKRRRLPVLGDWRVVSGAVAVGVTAVALLATNLGGAPLGGGGSPAAGGDGQATMALPGTPVEQSAPELLRQAAVSMAEEPVPEPREGSWVYVRDLDLEAGNAADENRDPMEEWYQYADSEFENWHEGDDHSPRERFEYLADLPEDTDAVLQKARWFYPESGERPTSENPGAGRSDEALASWNFAALGQLAKSAPAHPVGQSRVYAAMATIPGVSVVDTTVEDAAGRSALAFYLHADVPNDTGPFRDEFLIDPETYDYLGNRYVAIEDTESSRYGPKAEAGDVVISTAVIDTALVEEDGERP
ncbi:CU044_5270 family protein [Streptomyces sp. 184]|uniref:CU044_5270 family protein n=1 Tax=Streptomyces sp. 184 TaxID=1827526 RepID=UPI00389283C4